MSKETIKTASVLAFERNFDISDGRFYQTLWTERENKAPIAVNISEKSVRGTISNRLKKTIESDPVKLNAEIQKANLQTVDMAALSEDNDTLVVTWTLKVLPFTGKPCVCNDQTYQERLEHTLQTYSDTVGFKELARRYAFNIANARFLWRNRMGAEAIEVIVKREGKSPIKLDAKTLSLLNFEATSKEVADIAAWIEEGLTGKTFMLLEIETYAKVGKGQEVYPSQELILDQGNAKGKKSKTLYQVNEIAGLHAQKIGNALRTIDTWYPDAQFPIAAEPYGAVTTMGKAFRQPKEKSDFFTLFDKWISKGERLTTEEQYYVVAILIRGGVFGESGKE